MAIEQKPIDQKLKAFIIRVLRRSSYLWPARNEALKAARIERGFYKCASCKETFERKQVQLDHILPVVNIKGFTTWDDYILRMFPPAEGFSVLCISCHSSKTLTENFQRQQYKKKKK